MNIAPISTPNTTTPATAATQNVGRAAMRRSYSGCFARSWRHTNAASAATPIAASPSASAPPEGTLARLIARMSAPTSTAARMPPRLSTGSVDSFAWAGTKITTSGIAMMISGIVMRNDAPHHRYSTMAPASSGPIAETAPPIADHSAMALVRAAPDHSAVIKASVVGYAIPAATPPAMRARFRISIDGAKAASTPVGSERMMPSRSMRRRP